VSGACVPLGDGTACAGGVCESGLCCGPGTVPCGNACTDITSDPDNCGVCGLLCNTLGGCIHGQCAGDPCPNGTLACKDSPHLPLRCVDPLTDPHDCGGCGNVCLSQACNHGVCATPLP
jgi:hypothetical protein